MSNLTNKNGQRLIDQYNEAITIEDAIALATGEAVPMWKCGSDYDLLTDEGILYTTQIDEESYQATLEDYTISIEDIKAKYYEIKEELLEALENDLEAHESAGMSDDEKFAEIAEDVADALRTWQGSFYRQQRIIIAREFSCPLEYWKNLKCSI